MSLGEDSPLLMIPKGERIQCCHWPLAALYSHSRALDLWIQRVLSPCAQSENQKFFVKKFNFFKTMKKLKKIWNCVGFVENSWKIFLKKRVFPIEFPEYSSFSHKTFTEQGFFVMESSQQFRFFLWNSHKIRIFFMGFTQDTSFFCDEVFKKIQFFNLKKIV